MTRTAEFRAAMASGAPLAGTFLKTPSPIVIEVLAQSRLDFICLDAEHAPFGRAELDACIGMARALDLPALVRVEEASPKAILQALDYGAAGVVVPHVTSAEGAAAAVKAARFGPGGRGFAGSTRWAGYATRPMADVLSRAKEPIVIAQIEDPEAVPNAAAIAATDGIDGLFLGPADMTVGYGKSTQDAPELAAALRSVGEAARGAGKAYMSWVGNAAAARDWADRYGVTMFFIGSEHAWIRNGANADADGVHAIGEG